MPPGAGRGQTPAGNAARVNRRARRRSAPPGDRGRPARAKERRQSAPFVQHDRRLGGSACQVAVALAVLRQERDLVLAPGRGRTPVLMRDLKSRHSIPSAFVKTLRPRAGGPADRSEQDAAAPGSFTGALGERTRSDHRHVGVTQRLGKALRAAPGALQPKRAAGLPRCVPSSTPRVKLRRSQSQAAAVAMRFAGRAVTARAGAA
jgi:hypothetical protein